MSNKKIRDIALIKKANITESLVNTQRQYLVGDLQRDQILENIYDPEVAIGITNYPEGGSDLAHYHTEVAEYQYMLSGRLMVLNIDTWQEFEAEEGDSFAIPIQVCHILKAKPGTKILFVKNKCIDDKHLIEMNSKLVAWTKDLEF